MNRDLKIKNKDVKLQEFFTNYILLVTYLDKRYAEILGLLMSKYPSITIDEEMKKAISQILALRHKKTEYQNQMVSKSLSYLKDEGLIVKIQNGMYDLNDKFKLIAKNIKNKDKITITFNFTINE